MTIYIVYTVIKLTSINIKIKEKIMIRIIHGITFNTITSELILSCEIDIHPALKSGDSYS